MTIFNLSAIILAGASQRLGLPVRAESSLSVVPGWRGPIVRFNQLHIGQRQTAGPGDLISIDHGVVHLPWIALVSQSRLDEVNLSGVRLNLRRDAAGRPNWSSGEGGDLRLPTIQAIAISNADVDFEDAKRGLDFHGRIATEPSNAGLLLHLAGQGRVDGAPWVVEFHTPATLIGMDARPVELRLTVDRSSGVSAGFFHGRVLSTHGGQLEGALRATGPDLHDFAAVLGVPLPRTPAYQLNTDISASRSSVTLSAFSGRVGASDVSGAISVIPGRDGTRLDGQLNSRSLRLADLFEVASGGGLRQGTTRSNHLLPDAPIGGRLLRRFTGVLRLSAASVQSPHLRTLQLTTTFDRGRIVLAPLSLGLPSGKATLSFAVDARRDLPQLRFQGDLQGARTTDLLSMGEHPAVDAVINGHALLEGGGRSLSEAAANASGHLRLDLASGQLQDVQAAALSANLATAIVAEVSGSHRHVVIQRGSATFDVAKGVARTADLILVTKAGAVNGTGGFDLKTGALDLTLRPASPRMSQVTVIRLTGALAHPKAVIALDKPGRLLSDPLTMLQHAARRH